MSVKRASKPRVREGPLILIIGEAVDVLQQERQQIPFGWRAKPEV